MFTTLKQWLRSSSRKPQLRKPQARPRRFGAALEALEDRTVLNGNYFQLFNAGGTFSENWTTNYFSGSGAGWGGVPSIAGFSVDSGVNPGDNPAGIFAVGNPLNVEGDQPNAGTPRTVGIAEFTSINSDQTVGLAGSSAHPAPYLQFYLDTRQTGDVRMIFTLRDLDATNDAIQRFAVQYRVADVNGVFPNSFTNVTAGFVSDATGGGATQTTSKNFLLPNAVNNQEFVQVRIITADAANGGNVPDEWVGVDDIRIIGNIQPIITIANTPLPHIEDQTAIAFLDNNMGLTDDNFTTDFKGGKLTVDYVGGDSGATPEDEIYVNNQGVGLNNISVTGTVASGISIQYTDNAGTATIGTGNAGGGLGTTPLIITFTSAANVTTVRALLQNLAFRNLSQDPVSSVTIPRTVRLTISDGGSSTGQTSAPVTRPINVIPVNDSPVLTAGALNPIPEQSPPINVAPDATIYDPDSHDYAGGSLTIFIPATSNPTAFDKLSIENLGTASPLVGVNTATSEVTYGGVVIGTYAYTGIDPETFGPNSTTLVITFNAASTPAPLVVEAVMQAIQYQNTDDFPTVNPRPIRFIAFDNDGNTDPNDSQQGVSDPEDVSVQITPVNDVPVIAPSGGGVTYTENATNTPVAIHPTLTLTDPDSPNFGSGILTVDYDPAANGTADDRLTIRHQGTGIGQVSVAGSNISYNFPGSGLKPIGTIQSSGVGTTRLQVQFTAEAKHDVTLADPINDAVLAVLRAISFSNVSDNPVSTTRIVRITVTDGDGGTSTTITRTVDLTSVNDGPTFRNKPVATPTPAPQDPLSFPAVSYQAGFPAVLVAPNASLIDPDSATLDTGNLTVKLSGPAFSASDAIGIRNQGSGAGRIGIASNGTDVTYGGTVIGSFTGGTGGADLVVTFNDKATPAIAEALVDSITFVTPGAVGGTVVRTLTFTALDTVSPGGIIGNTATVNVTISRTAQPNDDFYAMDEDQLGGLSKPAGTLTANDPNPSQLVVTTAPVNPAINGPFMGTVTLGTDGSFVYVPTLNANGNDFFVYRWTNTSTFATGTAKVTIVISPVNDKPTAVFAPGSVGVIEDPGTIPQASTVTITPGGGTDEATQTVTRTVTNNNNALFLIQPAIDTATGKLSFTPALNANGIATVTLALQDSGGTFSNPADVDFESYTFVITVLSANDKPTFSVTSSSITASEDAAPQTVSNFATFSPAALSPPDEAGQAATYTFTPVGGALTFLAGPAIDAAGTLTYTLAPNSNGTASFLVRVRDDGGTANNGVDLSDAKTISFTVGASDDPPTVGNDSATVIWNSDPNPIPVLANDSGLPDANDTVAVSSVTQPANGIAVVVPGGGGVTYQPTPGFVGTDTFTYTAIDSQGVTAIATVTLNVIRYQTQPVDIVAMGAGPGGGSKVRLYNSKTGQFMGGFSAYAPEFTGGVSVAVADVNGDGTPDVIVGAGPGGGPHIQIIDGNRIGLLQGFDQIAPPSAMLGNFFGYDFSFRGGVTVAAGDVNGDGKADIILGTGPGGAAHVKIISGAQITNIGADLQPNPAAVLASFFAYDSSFRGGVKIATGDVNRDGYFDVIAAAGPGGASHVKAFSGRRLFEGGVNAPGVLLASFYGFDSNFRGGATIAAGDFNGDGFDDFIVGAAGAGGGSHVKVFSPFNLATPIASFFAFEPAVTTGVSVGYRMRSGGAAPLLLAATESGTTSRVATFAPPSFTTAGTIDVFDPSFLGGVDVG